MNFHNINLPEFIEVFADGYPEFLISKVSTISGREIRNMDRDYSLQKYVIKNCQLNYEQFEQFNNFFRGRRGQQFAFRFRDQADYAVNNQLIAKGDDISRDFQLFKLYEDQISPYFRKITKLVSDSVTLYLDDQETEAEIDYNRGIVKLSQVLAKDSILTANFMFDVMVRFGSNNFEYHYRSDGSIGLSTIELIEVYE